MGLARTHLCLQCAAAEMARDAANEDKVVEISTLKSTAHRLQEELDRVSAEVRLPLPYTNTLVS